MGRRLLTSKVYDVNEGALVGLAAEGAEKNGEG